MCKFKLLVTYHQTRGSGDYFNSSSTGHRKGDRTAAKRMILAAEGNFYKVINAIQDKEAENEPAADRADDVKPVEA